MSNVLIGIIGVILFIGLALAGALILGDDFRTANSDTKAAQGIQLVKQVGDAIQMSNLKRGTPFLASSPLSSLAPRFLKVAPSNPIHPWAFDTRDAAGNQTGPAIMTGFGFPLSDQNRDICLAAARSMGMPLVDDATVPTSTSLPSHPAGCYLLTGQWGGVGGNHYIMYSRV